LNEKDQKIQLQASSEKNQLISTPNSNAIPSLSILNLTSIPASNNLNQS